MTHGKPGQTEGMQGYLRCGVVSGWIDHDSPTPVWRQVYAIVLERIDTRVYDRRVPADRTLAVELGVAVGTVVRAMAELTAEGRIHSVRGKGRYVSGR